MAQREIKFRAWNKVDKRYEEISKLEYLDGQLVTIFTKEVNGVIFGYDPDDFVLEQYTGLKDMTGLEIYEGDRLLDEDGIVMGYVEMFEGRWWVDEDAVSDIYSQVYGNIHED